VPDDAVPDKQGVERLDEAATPVEPVAQRQEDTREHVAWWLLSIFGGTILLVVGLLGAGRISGSTAKDMLSILVPPEVSLLGAVTGFYYASRQR